MSPKELLLQTIIFNADNKENEMFEKIERFHEIYRNKEENDVHCIAEVIAELWSENMYNWAENIIYQHALQNNLISEKILQSLQKHANVVDKSFEQAPFKPNDIIVLLWNNFKLNIHYAYLDQDQKYNINWYNFLKDFMPIPPGVDKNKFFYSLSELIYNQNLNKYPLLNAMGYSLKCIYDIDSPIWHHAYETNYRTSYYFKKHWLSKTMPHLLLYQNFINKLSALVMENDNKDNVTNFSLDLSWFQQFNEEEQSILKHFIENITEKSDMKISIS